MKRFRTKKALATVAAFALIAGIGGAAFAFFTSSGSGTGSAQTGKASKVTISQIGAGYDSLITTNSYTEDQCMSACDGPNEIGNDITLANPASFQQLISVVVAVDNYGAGVGNVPMTLTINNAAAGPISDSIEQSFPAAINANTDPSETNVTFDFSSQDAFVSNEFVYGITFNSTPDTPSVSEASSLNVALSSSANDLSVGTDTTPGSIWMDDTNSNNGDFPTCTLLPTSGFEKVVTNCGPAAEPGAYGTNDQVTAGNDDIPAVEVNVVGGAAAVLFPGGPAQTLGYAITNPGAGPVQVISVSASVDTSGSNSSDVSSTSNGNDIPGCLAAWYQLNNSPQTLNGTSGVSIPPGTTIFTTNSPIASTMSIQLNNINSTQNACQGANVGLSFSSQ
jgi:hypothetical protein